MDTSLKLDALVAQLDRVLDYESRGRGFESSPARQHCPNPLFVMFACAFVMERRLFDRLMRVQEVVRNFQRFEHLSSARSRFATTTDFTVPILSLSEMEWVFPRTATPSGSSNFINHFL